MAIKGEGGADAQPLHDAEADGIVQGEVFIGVLIKDLDGPLFIALANADNDRVTRSQLSKKLEGRAR